MKGEKREGMGFGGGYCGSRGMGSMADFCVYNVSLRRIFDMNEYRVMFIWEVVTYALAFGIGALTGLVWGGALI